MSADNGYIIRKRRENGQPKFVLQMYFASDEDLPPINKAKGSNVFDTLHDAVIAYSKLNNAEPTEYGLRLMIEEFTS